jgi:interleukin-1 receptor-associated kinase 4
VEDLDGSFLAAATGNFDEARMIGEGAFGKVYEGVHLSIERRFAVKKLNSRTGAVDDFTKEIEVLRHFRHPHIIMLHGFSRAGDECCLVYELGSHGSLAKVLTNDAEARNLTWKLRVRVASGIAKALNYLHKQGVLPVFHRDVKSSNIVLDGSRMEAKLIDCGLSTLLKEEQIKTNQTIFTVTQGAALGTPGYMCPQFSRTRKYGERSEVYSFGVVLLEIITGKVQMVDDVDLLEEYDNETEVADLVSAADVRPEAWQEAVSSELASIALGCIVKHKKRPVVLPILRRLMIVEKEHCQPTIEEFHLTELADAQKKELELLRRRVQLDDAATVRSKKQCLVCFDEWGENEGLSCAQGHFFCDSCFSKHVETESQFADSNPDLLRQRGGRILCPIGSHEPAFTEQQIARHASDAAFGLHDVSRQLALSQPTVGGGGSSDSGAPPPSYLCPITGLLMEHPVTTANGNTYEYAAIAQWLSSHNTDPVTNAALASKTLTKALLVRSLIQVPSPAADRHHTIPHVTDIVFPLPTPHIKTIHHYHHYHAPLSCTTTNMITHHSKLLSHTTTHYHTP